MTGYYYGSKYLAVLNTDLESCYVEQVDIKPDHNETLVPMLRGQAIPHGTEHLYDSVEDAKTAVRCYLINTAGKVAVSLAAAIEIALQDAHLHKNGCWGGPKAEGRVKAKQLMDQVAKYRTELAALKRHYTRRIEVK